MFSARSPENQHRIPITAVIVLATLALALALSATAVFQVSSEYQMLGTWLSRPRPKNPRPRKPPRPCKKSTTPAPAVACPPTGKTSGSPPPPFEPPKPAELRAERAPMPELEPRSGATGWLIAAAILLLLAGGGYYAYSTYFQKQWPETLGAAPSTPSPVAEAPKKTVRDMVAEYLATKPTPEAMLAKGKELAQAGELGGAFLVWRRAAEAGNVQAQLEVAGFFDPLSPAKGGFTPDGARAADWYERAALAGLPEAQRKYGLLLAKGGAGLNADPAKAKSWLQQAAAQNDADAKKALESLPK